MPLPSLEEWLSGKLREERAPGAPFRISSAGDPCIRRLYYKAVGAPRKKDERRGLVKMALGTALDSLLLRSDGMARCQVALEARYGQLRVPGHADWVWGDNEHVADLKVVGLSTWEKTKKEPKKQHEAQVNLYADVLGAPTWSVLYVNAESGEMREHHRETDHWEALSSYGAFEEAAYYVAKRRPPARIAMDVMGEDGKVRRGRDSWECKYCPYQQTCWEGYVSEYE